MTWDPAELATTFADAWAARPGGEVSPAMRTRLAQLCDEARRAHGDLLADRELIVAIGSRCPAEDAEAYVDRCRGDQLALAIAASSGAPAALARFDELHGQVIERTCQRFARDEGSADDLRQLLREHLFVGPPPRLYRYAGQGLLDNWLRVTAARLFLDVVRRDARTHGRVASDGAVDKLPGPADLGLELIKSQNRTAVTMAMQAAVRGLDPAERHILRLHFVAGLTIDQISVAMGLHRSNAARRIGRGREALMRGVRKALARTHGLGHEEIDEMIGLVTNGLDLSIGNLLAWTNKPIP